MLLEEFEDLAIKQSFPVDLVPGQSHLFFQEHIHGNINNDTDITRVSLDMRILIEGEEYHRKLPGGYFRLPGDHAASVTYDCTGKHFITYAGWNTKFSKGIPLTMQRAIIDPYCNKNSISYSDYQFENEYLDWCPGLRSFIQNKPDGIVLCSIFSLPDDPEYRNDIIYLALENNVELHFANEMLVIKNKSDVNSINEYLNFAVHKDHNR
jgi:sporadic carbohydrate cluster protein (TIGR04323 family)